MGILTPEVAEQIVERTTAVIGRNVNVMDAGGLVLASGDPARRHQRHEGALLAAQGDRATGRQGDRATGRQGDRRGRRAGAAAAGVRPGVNVPLRHAGQVVGVVGISGDPAEVGVLAELIGVTAELILEQAVALERGQRRQQEREDHLLALVGGGLAPERAARRGRELGIPEDRRRCTLVRADGARGVELMRSLERRLVRRTDLLVARTRPEELALWWTEDASRAVQEVLAELEGAGGGLRALSGGAFDGPDGLRRAWLAAQDAWAVSHVSPELYEPRDLPLVALLCGLRGDWRAEALAAPWRALQAADRHGELVATLRAWFDSGMSPLRCTRALHVHRNTLRGRLDRIERVTGLDLTRVPDLLQLYLGPLLASQGPAGTR